VKPSLAIVTVCFNAATDLEETIKSVVILKSISPNVSVSYIVVDGESSDNTKDVIEKYKLSIDIAISEPDSGIYDAMNKGLKLVDQDAFVWFVNAGDLVCNGDVIVEKLEEFADNVDLLYGDILVYRRDGYKKRVKSKKDTKASSFMRGMVVSHQAMLVKRRLCKNYSLRYRLVSDQDWAISCFSHARCPVHLDAVLCQYLLGGISDRVSVELWVEKFIIGWRHFGACSVLVNSVALVKSLIRNTVRVLYGK